MRGGNIQDRIGKYYQGSRGKYKERLTGVRCEFKCGSLSMGGSEIGGNFKITGFTFDDRLFPFVDLLVRFYVDAISWIHLG